MINFQPLKEENSVRNKQLSGYVCAVREGEEHQRTTEDWLVYDKDSHSIKTNQNLTISLDFSQLIHFVQFRKLFDTVISFPD